VRSDKIKQSVQEDVIVLTSTCGVQIMVLKDKLLITESAKLGDEHKSSGLCSINIRDLSRSVPRDVLRAVLQQQKLAQLGPQTEDQIRKIDSLMVLLNQRMFPIENQQRQWIGSSLTKICTFTVAQNNEEISWKPINSDQLILTSGTALRTQFPDYCQILKTDLISVRIKITPQQREIKVLVQNNNDVVRIVQLQGESIKLMVGDEERDSLNHDDLSIQRSRDNEKLIVTTDQFEMVVGNKEDKSAYVKIKVLAPLGSWGSSVCQLTPEQIEQTRTSGIIIFNE